MKTETEIDPLRVFNLFSPLKANLPRWGYIAIRLLLRFETNDEVGRLLMLTQEEVQRLRDMEMLWEPIQ